MKILGIITLFALCVTVKGAWWALAAQPVILAFGAAMVSMNRPMFSNFDINTFDWKKFFKKEKPLTEHEINKQR